MEEGMQYYLHEIFAKELYGNEKVNNYWIRVSLIS
jgi:hypothetical protein